jgi:hypothetical protein
MIVGKAHRTNKNGYFLLILARNEQGLTITGLITDTPQQDPMTGELVQVEDEQGRVWYLMPHIDVQIHTGLPAIPAASFKKEIIESIVMSPDVLRRIVSIAGYQHAAR